MDSLKLGTLGRTPHLPSRIASEILQEIAEGRLRPGDKLPTETALAERMGVSRNVVREAISRLRSEGIVQSRQGVGAFVVRASGTPTLRFDAETLTDIAAFRNMFELRALVEVRSAGLAALRRTDEQLAAIAHSLEAMRSAERWEDSGVDADVEFHRNVAQATGNSYITMVISFLSEQVRLSIMEARSRHPSMQEIIDITIAEHVAIYDAIAAGSAPGSRDAMWQHIRNAAQRIGAGLPDLGEY